MNILLFFCLSFVCSWTDWSWNQGYLQVGKHTTETVYTIPKGSKFFFYAFDEHLIGEFEFTIFETKMGTELYISTVNTKNPPRWYSGVSTDLDPEQEYQFNIRTIDYEFQAKNWFFAAGSDIKDFVWFKSDFTQFLPTNSTPSEYLYYDLGIPPYCQNLTWTLNAQSPFHVEVNRYLDGVSSDFQTMNGETGQSFQVGVNSGFFLYFPYLVPDASHKDDFIRIKNDWQGLFQLDSLNVSCYTHPIAQSHGDGGGGTTPTKWGKDAQNGFSIAITVLIGICVFCCCCIVFLFCVGAIGLSVVFGVRKGMGYEIVSDAFDSAYT